MSLSLFSRYGRFERIGSGGMGVVYRAEDTTLQRAVALKFLTGRSYGAAELRARFLREARTAAALNHPNICTIHEVGEVEPGDEAPIGIEGKLEPGTPFIAMELVEGRTLKHVLAESGRLPLERLLKLALQIADGLAAAHEKGIVHRDLKPGNAMVTADDRIKILDFGLAKPTQPVSTDRADGTKVETISAELTGEGRIVGTVAYMSPEQAEGKPVDPRSDVFSLGIMLYEMATGQRPFAGDSSLSILSSILKEQPRPVTELSADLPRELSRIVNRCLAKDPKDRFQSAAGVRSELAALEGELQSGELEKGIGPTKAARSSRRWVVPVGAAAAIVGLAVVFGPRWLESSREGGQPAATVAEVQRIVVLPFENLGPPEDEYFAAGMTEEITSRLAAVSGLGVISRTSAYQYDRTGKTLMDVGEDLDVDFVLEGTVRWARGGPEPSRVRITPQLIRVADDTHVWSDAYDRVVDDIFEVQSDIASKVIGQLGVSLLGSERRAVEVRPTENQEAYRAYLKGLHYRSGGVGESPAAVASLERAVELDPGFVLAWAELSEEHSWVYFFGQDTTPERLVAARRALNRAVELDPDAPQVHKALGISHYHGRDYDRALAELELAARFLPSDADLFAVKGYVLRRRARWEDATGAFLKSLSLNPRERGMAQTIAETFMMMRRYPEALEYAEEAIALEPSAPSPYFLKANILRLSAGDLEGAQEAQESAPSDSLRVFDRHRWFWQETCERRYHDALERLASAPEDWYRIHSQIYPKALLQAFALEWMGEIEPAREHYETARSMLEDELQQAPDEARLHSSLGLALAGLGRKKDAMHEGERAVELLPVSKDALFGAYVAINLADICTRVGEHDAAVDQLEHVLSIPAEISVPLLRIDPRWDPLRDHTRFQRLLEKNEKSSI